MARYEFRLPDIGEGVTEGEVVAWLVEPGQHVREDQPMVEVMTDKATVTIAAPKTGKIVETRAKAGEVVKVHAVLVVFEVDAGESRASQRSEGGAEAPLGGNGAAKHGDGSVAATAVGDIREDLPGMGLVAKKQPHEAPSHGERHPPAGSYY